MLLTSFSSARSGKSRTEPSRDLRDSTGIDRFSDRSHADAFIPHHANVPPSATFVLLVAGWIAAGSPQGAPRVSCLIGPRLFRRSLVGLQLLGRRSRCLFGNESRDSEVCQDFGALATTMDFQGCYGVEKPKHGSSTSTYLAPTLQPSLVSVYCDPPPLAPVGLPLGIDTSRRLQSQPVGESNVRYRLHAARQGRNCCSVQ